MFEKIIETNTDPAKKRWFRNVPGEKEKSELADVMKKRFVPWQKQAVPRKRQFKCWACAKPGGEKHAVLPK